MPDLNEEAIEVYWQSKGADLARTVAEIERVEDWAADDSPKLRAAVEAFGHAMDRAAPGRFASIAGDQMAVDSARIALAYIRAGKRFRVLAALAEEREDGPALAGRVLSPEADDADAQEATRVLRGSVRHLARLNLLHRIFSPERLALIRTALAEAQTR